MLYCILATVLNFPYFKNVPYPLSKYNNSNVDVPLHPAPVLLALLHSVVPEPLPLQVRADAAVLAQQSDGPHQHRSPHGLAHSPHGRLAAHKSAAAD